jgi:hypothetical protein
MSGMRTRPCTGAPLSDRASSAGVPEGNVMRMAVFSSAARRPKPQIPTARDTCVTVTQRAANSAARLVWLRKTPAMTTHLPAAEDTGPETAEAESPPADVDVLTDEAQAERAFWKFWSGEGTAKAGAATFDRARLTVPAGLVIIAAHVALTIWRVSSSWWRQDDYKLIVTVADRALTPALLFEPYTGHLIPGTWLATWLTTHLAGPYEWGWAAATTTLLVAVTDLALLALLVRLFGRRPGILVPLTLFVVSPITIASITWWAAALQWLPTCLFLALALFFHVGYLRTGSRRDAIAAVLCVVGGLFFFEKAAMITPVLALFALGYGRADGRLQSPLQELRERPKYWAAHAVVLGGYVALFMAIAKMPETGGGDAGAVPDSFHTAIFRHFLPGMTGGPGYRTLGSSPVVIASPPGWLVWTAALLTVGAIAASVARDRRAWRAWVILALFAGASVGLVAATRVAAMGSAIMLDGRYLTDSVIVAAICVALAFLPLRHATVAPEAAPEAERSRRRVGATLKRWVAPTDTGEAATPLLPPAGTAVVAVLVIVIAAGGVVAGRDYMEGRQRNLGYVLLNNLRADLEARDEATPMFDMPVPADMVVPLLQEANDLSELTALFPRPPVFVTHTSEFFAMDWAGRLHKGTVYGDTTTLPPRMCTTPPTDGTLKLPLSKPAKPGVWTLRIGYVSPAAGEATLRFGAATEQIELKKGLNVLFVRAFGGGKEVVLADLPPGLNPCVASVTVGQPVPEV